MSLDNIVESLKEERDRLDRAISALEGMGGDDHRKRRRRHMSADARRRISVMMKKRWADRKKNPAKK